MSGASETTREGLPDVGEEAVAPPILVERVSDEWEEQVLRAYESVALWLGHFFLFLTLWRLERYSATPLKRTLVLESLAEMALFYLAGYFIKPLNRLLRDVENVGFLLVALASANGIFLVAVLPGAVQISTFMLIQMGAAVAFRSRWRFLLVQGTTLGLCAGAFWFWTGLDVLLGEVFTLLSSLLVSVAIWVFINRLLFKLAVMRAKDRVLLRQRSRLLAELRGALKNVRALRGLIPTCDYCKRVRDDHGTWQHVEAFIHQRSEARFSHMVCPSCHSELEGEVRRLRSPDKGQP
ncbi:hypothetical protein GETHLI_03290 [Geothrix limicola]|uniref:Uncharacterized protein n=1 Tax=Geothrix limicola TaxID=2927978 RepID=A0ABQ5QAH6_9BACT|nr:hypothetical protein [Geothrix limicola]GLH71827.1 hypothetical protein GETHLI_03290 [Geothrix limicola]